MATPICLTDDDIEEDRFSGNAGESIFLLHPRFCDTFHMTAGGYKTCLLVDDDLDDQEIFAMALQQVNASMQCMDGRQCLIEIRRQSHLQDIPLAIYSTSSDEHFQLEMKELGATAYIVKPTLVSLLKKTLNEFFSHH